MKSCAMACPMLYRLIQRFCSDVLNGYKFQQVGRILVDNSCQNVGPAKCGAALLAGLLAVAATGAS